MATIVKPNDALEFPQRLDRVRGEWTPVYIEPMVGSGERMTIAVAVAGIDGAIVVPVVALNRLECVYGTEVQPLLFARDVVIKQLNGDLASKGQDALRGWQPPMEGVYLGDVRPGAGASLEEIARTGLMLCSSLVEKLAESEEAQEPREGITTSKLERLVKEKVVAARPNLEVAFARQFRPTPNARPATIGFVGWRIAANFALLVPGHLAYQVNYAKARLWDLGQLQDYVKNPQFDLSTELNQFELLINRIREDDPQYSDRQILAVQEAINELEQEADHKEIRCRPLGSPDEIARIIIDAEAA